MQPKKGDWTKFRLPKGRKNCFPIFFPLFKILGKIELTFHINTWWSLPLYLFLATSAPVFLFTTLPPAAPHLVAFSHLPLTRFPSVLSVHFIHLHYVHYNSCLTKVKHVPKKIHFTLITNIIIKDFWMAKNVNELFEKLEVMPLKSSSEGNLPSVL